LRKKKQKHVIIFSFIIVTVIIGLFPIPTGRESIVKSIWYSSVTKIKPIKNEQNAEARIWYKIGNIYGYTDLNGNIYLREKSSFFTSLTDTVYTDYSKVAENFYIKNSDGTLLGGFKASGYPFFDKTGKRLLVVKTDLSGISEITRTGKAKWKKDFISMITTVSVSSKLIVVGLLDGSMEILNGKGEIIYQFKPTGSKIPVIVGTAISDDENLIVCISGLKPQKILIFKKQNGRFSLFLSKETNTDFRREALIKFGWEGRFILTEGEHGVNIVDVLSGKLTPVKLKGAVKDIAVLNNSVAAVVVSELGNRSYFDILDEYGSTVLHAEFNGKTGSLRQIKNHIIMGLQSGIMGLDIEGI